MFSHQVNPLNTDKNICPHLNDGLDVPRKPPEPCWHIGKLQLWGALQELLQELLVLAVEQRLLGAVVHVEDLEEDAEDDGDDHQIEHLGGVDSQQSCRQGPPRVKTTQVDPKFVKIAPFLLHPRAASALPAGSSA